MTTRLRGHRRARATSALSVLATALLVATKWLGSAATPGGRAHRHRTRRKRRLQLLAERTIRGAAGQAPPAVEPATGKVAATSS